MINEDFFIVNGDDFGYNTSINHAIVEAFRQEKINSTTIMANMPGFEEAIELAHSNKLIDKIGAHLVLTEGSPITEKINRLDFLFTGPLSKSTKYKKLFYLSKEHKALIFNELSAQIEKIRRYNIEITHVDTHHHTHSMWPIIQILSRLLKDYKIPSMRIQFNLIKENQIMDGYRNLINRYIRFKKMNFSHYLGDQIYFLNKYGERPEFWRRKKVEIMVHPDYNSEGKLIDRMGRGYDFNFVSLLSEDSGI